MRVVGGRVRSSCWYLLVWIGRSGCGGGQYVVACGTSPNGVGLHVAWRIVLGGRGAPFECAPARSTGDLVFGREGPAVGARAGRVGCRDPGRVTRFGCRFHVVLLGAQVCGVGSLRSPCTRTCQVSPHDQCATVPARHVGSGCTTGRPVTRRRLRCRPATGPRRIRPPATTTTTNGALAQRSYLGGPRGVGPADRCRWQPARGCPAAFPRE